MADMLVVASTTLPHSGPTASVEQLLVPAQGLCRRSAPKRSVEKIKKNDSYISLYYIALCASEDVEACASTCSRQQERLCKCSVGSYKEDDRGHLQHVQMTTITRV